MLAVLRGVVEEVGENLPEPGRVGVEVDWLRWQFHDQCVAAGVDDGAARFHGVVQHRCEFDPLLAELQFPATDATHVEQVVDEVDHLCELTFHHRADALDRRRVVRDPQNLQAVTDWCERVAEFVRERREEFVFAAAGLGQFRRDLAQIFLECPLFGNVGIRAEDSYRRSGFVADDVHPRQKPAILAVLAAQRKCVFPVDALLNVFGEFSHDIFDVIGVMNRYPAAPLHLFQSGSGILEPIAIEPVDLTVGVGIGDPCQLGDVVRHRAESHFALAELFLRAFLFAQIDDERHSGPVAVLEANARDQDRYPRAILAEVLFLVSACPAGLA